MTEQLKVDHPTMTGHRVTRSRRWWALIVVAAVVGVGFAYEFFRYDHETSGHLGALIVAALLALGVVATLADPGRSRLGRALLALALSVGLLFCVGQLRTSPDPLVGNWTATFQGTPPGTVAITRSVVGYTVMATTAARLPGYQCDLPPGTVLATFDGSAPGYTGWQLAGNPINCQLSGWEPGTFDLTDPRSLRERVPSQHNLLFTKLG